MARLALARSRTNDKALGKEDAEEHKNGKQETSPTVKGKQTKMPDETMPLREKKRKTGVTGG